MNKLKHTPGPWKVSVENEGSIFGDLDNPKHDGDSPYIGTVAGIGPDKKDRECRANAKLIEASPDILQALIKVRDHLKDYTFGDNPERTDVYNSIVAAIDKATK